MSTEMDVFDVANTASLATINQALVVLRDFFQITENKIRIPELRMASDRRLELVWCNGVHSLEMIFREDIDAEWCYTNNDLDGYLAGTFTVFPPESDQRYPRILFTLLPLFHVP